MADQRIEVSIGARIDELMTEFQKASASVTTSVNRLADNVDRAMEKVESSSNEATRSIQKMEAEAASGSNGMMASFGNVGSFISGVLGPIIASFSLKAAIDTVLDFANTAEELGNTAQIVGTTATAISRLHASAAPLGIEADSINTGMKKLARTMTEAARGGEEAGAAFEAIGLSAEELKGMSIEQVIAKISDKFAGTEDGATKAALSMALLGKSGAELIPWLNQGSEAMTAVADEAEAMGAVMGEDAVAAGSALDDAMDKLNMQSAGLKNQFSQALAPAVQFIAEMFTEGSATATSFGDVFKAVATIVIAVTAVIKAAWEIISGIVRAISVSIFSVVDAIAMLAQGDWTGAKAALQTGGEMVMETMNGMADNLGALKDKTAEAMAGIWDAAGTKPKGAPDTPELPKGEIDFKPKTGGGGGGGDGGAAAEAKKAALEKFQYEMEMLRNELEAAQKGGEERLRIQTEITERIKLQYGEESKEYARAQREQTKVVAEVEAEKRRVKDQALTSARDLADRELEIERGKLDYMLATGQINQVQKLQMERQFAEQGYQMEMAYLQSRLEMYATEPKVAEQIYQQLEQLKQNHILKMQGFQTADFQANKGQWDSYFQVVNDAFSNSIQGMIFQGTTLREAMGNILQAILGQLIQTGVKMATNWAATQLAMTSATVAGAATRTTAEVASAKTSTAANATAGIKNIITKAAEVFANVYSAIAGIPFVGPVLAPVMAVAAGAAVIGMVGKVASAEGGWERVPYDGAMAQLHKEEMVLPAPLAEGLRQLVENGGGNRGGITIHALDRKDVQRYFSDNNELLYGALSQYAMNNPGGF